MEEAFPEAEASAGAPAASASARLRGAGEWEAPVPGSAEDGGRWRRLFFLGAGQGFLHVPFNLQKWQFPGTPVNCNFCRANPLRCSCVIRCEVSKVGYLVRWPEP